MPCCAMRVCSSERWISYPIWRATRHRLRN